MNFPEDDIKLIETRKKVEEIASIYEQTSNELKQPVQFLRFADENQINNQISGVFEAAASFLRKMTNKEVAMPESMTSLIPDIHDLRDQLEELSYDVEEQEISFDQGVTMAREIFNDKASTLNKEYQSRITQILIQNTNEEIQLEKTLDSIKDTIENQIEKEFANNLAERDEVHRQLMQLKRDYEETNNFLTSQIMAIKGKEIANERSAGISRDISQDLMDDLSPDLSKSVSINFTEEIEKKMAQKQKLTQELQQLNQKYAAEKENLQKEIEKYKSKAGKSVEKAVNKQLSNYEKRKQKLDELFKDREKQLNQKIEHVKKHNQHSTKKIRAEIEQHKKNIAECDDKLNRTLKEINDRMNVELSKKDKEKQKIINDFNVEVEELKKAHKEAILKIKNSHEKKPAEFEVKVPKSDSRLDTHSPRRNITQQKLFLDPNDTILNLERASNKELTAINNAINAAKDQYEINQRILKTQIDQAKQNFIFVEKKKELTNLNIKNLEKLSNTLKNKRNNLCKQISQNDINQVNQELEKIKNSSAPKVELSVIQNEYKAERDKKISELNEMRNSCSQLVENLNKYYNKLIIDEKKKRQKQAKNMSIMLSEAEEELRKIRSSIECQPIKNHILKINNNEATKRTSHGKDKKESAKRAVSVQRIKIDPKLPTTLPLLKH